MARGNGTTKSTQNSAAATSNSVVDTVEQQVVAFAEQLGRIVGTVQAKAEGWLDRDALNEQVSRVRDSASALLEQLGGEKSKASKPAAGIWSARAKTMASASGKRGRSGGVVDAPGKKHRKPTPNTRLRTSAADSGRVAKMKTLHDNRRRGGR